MKKGRGETMVIHIGYAPIVPAWVKVGAVALVAALVAALVVSAVR